MRRLRRRMYARGFGRLDDLQPILRPMLNRSLALTLLLALAGPAMLHAQAPESLPSPPAPQVSAPAEQSAPAPTPGTAAPAAAAPTAPAPAAPVPAVQSGKGETPPPTAEDRGAGDGETTSV